MIISRALLLWMSLFISFQVFSQTGAMPVWVFTDDDGGDITLLDWRDDPATLTEFNNPIIQRWAGTAVAFDDCGDVGFYAIHDGSGNQNSLFIFDREGQGLLTTTTPNGPGFNGVKGDGEIQVVRVPETNDEWYLVYRRWATDSGAPGSNGTYTATHILYSRVQYDGTSLTVLERDVTLTDDSGIAHTYVDGKAVSAEGSDANSHYLYLCRRSAGSSVISADRFLMDNTSIRFDKNTGDVNSNYWNLTAAGSYLELSHDGSQLAVVARNQSSNRNDVFIFNTDVFDNTPGNYQGISGNDLILQPDGVNLLTAMSVQSAAGITGLNHIGNFERKLSRIEFSPSGQYLYITSGGYVASGLSNITYLAQIDLNTTYPFDVRFQIQEVPFSYNPFTGGGCSTGDPDCLAQYNAISDINYSVDGNLYFTKRAGTKLFVVPDPDDPMPQSLLPGDVDLSDADEPNIETGHNIIRIPDQIDGYNYLIEASARVPMIVRKTFCGDTCTTYELTIQASGAIIETYEVEACPQNDFLDTIFFCADSNIIYDLVETNGTSYSIAIDGAVVQYPGDPYFDFTSGSLDNVSFDVQEDYDPCVDLTATLSAINVSGGTPPYSYSLNNGVPGNDPVFTDLTTGTYSIEVRDANGCVVQKDDIDVNVGGPFSITTYGDAVIEAGDTVDIGINVTGSPDTLAIIWQPSSSLSCFLCPSTDAYPIQSTAYVVVASNASGCTIVDTVFITVEGECEVDNVFVPNAFSPNRDGLNDIFNVRYDGLYNSYQLIIYDRWGQEVFESSDLGIGWDGIYDGKLQSGDVFSYHMMLDCGQGKITRQGSITLLQ